MKFTNETTHVAAKNPNWMPIYEHPDNNTPINAPPHLNPRSKSYRPDLGTAQQYMDRLAQERNKLRHQIDNIKPTLKALKQKYGDRLRIKSYQDSESKGYEFKYYGEELPPDLAELPMDYQMGWTDEYSREEDGPVYWEATMATHYRRES
jgi:hypothetical protein